MNLVDCLLGKIKDDTKHVVVIGDAIVDLWVHGHTSRCQENCTRFVQEKVVETSGGAANAEHCLSHWGVGTLLYSYLGRDCSIKCRYVEDEKVIFRADHDRLPSGDYAWVRQVALEAVYSAGGVLISDYDKGFLPPEFIRGVVATCRDRGVPCVADCKRAPELYSGCVLKCNSDYHYKYNAELSALVDAGPRSSLVVTDGPRTPAVWDAGKSVKLGLGFLLPVRCVNHVGAGDCFAAHLTLALAYGFSLKDAAVLAHGAGRVYVQHPHNRPPLPSEVAVNLSSVR